MRCLRLLFGLRVLFLGIHEGPILIALDALGSDVHHGLVMIYVAGRSHVDQELGYGVDRAIGSWRAGYRLRPGGRGFERASRGVVCSCSRLQCEHHA
jgi:hypothetical protein